MIKKYDAIDWQSFSQKKDIEEIVKNTRNKNWLQISGTIEMAMFVSSIVAENLFENNLPKIVWLIIFFISMIPLVWFACKLFKFIYTKYSPGSDIPNIQEMVNLFDNDICYYALMAESYSDKLLLIDDKENISEIDKFYFLESCFYINKTIYNLSLTSNCKDKLYSNDENILYKNRKISLTRLNNIFNIINNILSNIKNYEYIISDIDDKNNYIKLLEKYETSYNIFKDLFKDLNINAI